MECRRFNAAWRRREMAARTAYPSPNSDSERDAKTTETSAVMTRKNSDAISPRRRSSARQRGHALLAAGQYFNARRVLGFRASRLTAGASGFFILSQSGERPER